MSAESPRHARSGGPLTVPAQPPSDRSLIDAVSGFINDVTLSSTAQDPKDVIQWARFETADINEPTPEGDSDNDISPLLLILGYGSGVQVWLIPPSGEAQEVLSWRQGTVRVLRILPTPQHGDAFASKRPLIALCDSASPGPSFCSLSFISIRGGEQVKSIKFKNPILDVLANKRSVVVSFSERFAVFDAATLEDRLAVTTCYPCPCPLGGSAPINPLALGDRWLAYADKKLNQSKRSSGGCEGEGQTSYTATVLHAAKSLSKGLRGLGESVAHSLAGTRSASQSPSPPAADAPHPGLVTILDIEANDDEDVGQDTEEPCDPIVAHFVAHSEAIIAMKFDPSGMLLVTADRRGHDFHVFRINPHPCGPSLASVHHLYILHRGDTTAKVQDIAISLDSRWVAISTLRGTTHLFAMSPYGGACAVRTHTAPRVVNRLSRFHRSAGLPIHAGHAHAHTHHSTGSPVSDGIAGAWFPNPRLPPYPVPTVNTPLAQLRPTAALPTHTITRTSSGRQRLSSVSEESGVAPLLARARFGVAGVPAAERGGAGLRAQASAALYLMAASGCLSHIALHPRPARNVPKEKISDDTSIELEVEPVAQWPLQRPPAAADLLAPLPPGNPLLQPLSCRRMADMCMSEEERWLSQVEIVTHAGPHRRLWMGPQFVFKTYNCTGSNSSLSEAEAVEIEAGGVVGGRGEVARSNPVNVPAAARPLVPVLVDSGSASSLEHSPSDNFRRKSLLAESGRVASVCDVQLKEDLAEAMKEDHGGREVEARGARRSLAVSRAVDPLGTVVAPAEPSPGGPVSSPPDDDAHTRSNDDEATFRPVVRAPAPPDHHPELELARPLPHTTTIPVQSISALEPPTPPEPHPLSTDVIIPAALTPVPWSAPELDHPETDQPEAVEKPEVPHRPPPSPRETDDGRKRSPKPEKREPVVEAKIPEPKNRTKEAKREETKEVAVEIEKTNKRRENSSKIEKTEAGPAAIADNLVKLDESPAVVSTVDSVNVDIKSSDVNKDLRRQEIDGRPRDRGSAERAERVDSKSLPKSNRSSDDIQPTASVRLKKSPTPKSVSDRDSEASYKDKFKRNDESKDVIEPKELKETKELKEPKEIKKQKDVKDFRGKVAAVALSQEFKDIDLLQDRPVKKEPKEPIVNITKEPTVPAALKTFTKKEDTNSKKREEIEIKTEEQAWDMLLNEPEKPITLSISPPATEDKQKSKKNRKIKKNQEDVQAKTDDDSFVEIHAIEEKQQICSGELVSISSPFEDVDPTISYLSKIKKSRKSLTPEKREDSKSIESGPQEEPELLDFKLKSIKKYEDKDIEVLPSPAQVQKEIFKETTNNILKSKKHSDGTASESSSFFLKETPKPMKSKSLSPYPELRKHDKSVDIEKDVYVINTAEDDFPEIQITRGTKPRKRSPQPVERKSVERGEPVTDKPIKSWSSIAASKNVKKDEEKKVDIVERKYEKCDRDEETVSYPMSSTTASLQEKLFELCKRTDIMVAECDAPSELNFVDEHHAVLHDLPPLEPLDFGLDDFKLEVMRDSLLEVNDTKTTSPICKINIDDILSSIKETTAKAIESSAFNLIDLEKVPAKKEKGFSVIEEHKITSQEVKLDDDGKEEKEGEMEKSSEDDTSPVVSTDSDKEDRKNAGASNIVLPSLKQSAKSKKSRRKKK